MNDKLLCTAAMVAATIGCGLHAAPAAAQTGTMTRTWVSGTTAGNDNNMCTRSSPCQTINRALTQTVPGGEVNCIDAGGFGAIGQTVSITASVSIVCENTEAGILTTAATNGILINGAGAVVTLVGLDIDGFGTGTNGIQVTNAAAVVLDNVKVRNFTGFGVRFEPTAAATLTLKKSMLTGNGTAATITSGGLYVRPAANSGVTVADAQISNNANDGVRVDPAGGTTNISISRSVVSGNATGIRFRVPTGAVIGTVTGTSVVNNTGFGMIGNGAGLQVAVSDTTISGNATGISGTAGLTSFGDNRLFGNTTSGSFGGTQVKQ